MKKAKPKPKPKKVVKTVTQKPKKVVAKPKKATAKKKKFDADNIAALLNKIPDAGPKQQHLAHYRARC